MKTEPDYTSPEYRKMVEDAESNGLDIQFRDRDGTWMPVSKGVSICEFWHRNFVFRIAPEQPTREEGICPRCNNTGIVKTPQGYGSGPCSCNAGNEVRRNYKNDIDLDKCHPDYKAPASDVPPVAGSGEEWKCPDCNSESGCSYSFTEKDGIRTGEQWICNFCSKNFDSFQAKKVSENKTDAYEGFYGIALGICVVYDCVPSMAAKKIISELRSHFIPREEYERVREKILEWAKSLPINPQWDWLRDEMTEYAKQQLEQKP